MRLSAIVRATFLLPALVSLAGVTAPASSSSLPEPNVELAKQWWPDLTDIWTPVGWKHHRFRYNVFFDGTIYADPALSQTAKEWKGQGVQIRVMPLAVQTPPQFTQMRSERYALEDDYRCRQGWTHDKTPVLWTEWSKDGLLLRENVFAYVPGAGPVKDGLEPLFAWVRLSVHETAAGLPLPKRYAFCLQLNAPHVRPKMFVRQNILMDHKDATYPRALKADLQYNAERGLNILEPDGKVRLAIAPGAKVEAGLIEGDGQGKDPLVYIFLEAKKGQYVDVLVPMIPTEAAIVNEVVARGYDGALQESQAFWAERPATAATIDVPEDDINDTFRQFERFVEVLSEREPETGRNIPLSGSLAYVKTWATPTGKLLAMFLDSLGYHDLAGEYLEPFIEAQGTRKPPSKHLPGHPGYLGSPEKFISIDWMPDHGSLLNAIANHALLSRDQKLKARYAEVVVKACEFIRDARRVKGHGGVEGILPPARYSDRADMTQGVWSDGWNFKGLATGARLLRQIGHPRAAEFTAETEDYRRVFLAAFRAEAARANTWTDAQGKARPFIPTTLHGHVEASSRHGFYLDTGPLVLVFAGLMEAKDPLMEAALEWFRAGPPQQLARFGSHYTQVPFLRHEMSSCIPGYSWNVFHSHQLGDRRHFLEGMYSQFAGAVSRQTRTVCETRGGITGRITHADTPFYLARLAVVDDLIVENELHLLRLCPLAWIQAARPTRFERMPTEFGPVTLRWQLSDDGRTLRVDYVPSFHSQPGKVLLHCPPVPGLTHIVVNGTRHAVPAKGILTL